MTRWIHAWGGWSGIVGVGLLLAGCGKPAPTDAPKTEVTPGPEAGGTPPAEPGAERADTNINFQQSFDEAVLTEALPGQQLPPNVTFAGKKTGVLRMAVEETWPKVKLTDAAGNVVPYVVTLETSEGTIEIQLRPNIAPNHVRNFLTLVHLGYYDGMCFERIVRQEAELDGVKSRLDLLIAGCPAGSGDEGAGHIGYFVRSEFQEDLKHEAGTVGFWHEEDPDSAGCRFYITLGPAPALDGKFTIIGKVTKGLDAAKKIADLPVLNANAYPDSEKPVKPATIRTARAAPAAVAP